MDSAPAHVFVCGRTRSGKTRASLARAISSHPGPVLFVNTQEEKMAAGWISAGRRDKVASILRALRAGRRICYLPSPGEFGPLELEALVSILFGAGLWAPPLLLIVDEAHVYAPQGRRPGALHRVALRGLRWGIQLVLISPRPAAVDKGLVTQCAEHRIFATSWEGDYFASHGVPAERVRAILEAAGPYSYVVFDGASVSGPFKEILPG